MRRAHLQLEEGRDDQSTYYTRVNVGKESLALDLAHPAARAVVLDLARRADVAIENFVPGVAARLGCDAAALAAVKPDLVYCSISGFGQTGPWRDRAAFAHIVNAASGMMHLERGDAAGAARREHPGRRRARGHARLRRHPRRPLAPRAHRRGRAPRRLHARGPHRLRRRLATARCSTAATRWARRGPACGCSRSAGATSRSRPRGAPALWPRLVALLGRPELAADPRFATPLARRENQAALRVVHRRVDPRFATVDAALAALDRRAHPVRAGPGARARSSRIRIWPRAEFFPDGAASHPRVGARHRHTLPPRRRPGGAGGPGAVSHRRAHARGARRACSATIGRAWTRCAPPAPSRRREAQAAAPPC